MLQVIATARGYDGTVVREPGEVFSVPDNTFDKRPKLYPKDTIGGLAGKPTGEFYDLPTWFKPRTNERQEATKLRLAATAASEKANAAPGDATLADAATEAREKAEAAEAKADAVDVQASARGKGSDRAAAISARAAADQAAQRAAASPRDRALAAAADDARDVAEKAEAKADASEKREKVAA